MSGKPSIISLGDRARFLGDCCPSSTPAHRAPLIWESASNTPATNLPGKCARSSGTLLGSVESYSAMKREITLSFSISPFSVLMMPSDMRVSMDLISLRRTSSSMLVPEPRWESRWRSDIGFLFAFRCHGCTGHPAKQPCRGFTHPHSIRRRK
jgi:hypothetical protein